MASRSVRLKDLKAATEASVKAVLGRKVMGRGVLIGLWLDKSAISKLGVTANSLARDVSKQVSVMSGLRVTPGIRPGRGGVLVGFIPPKLSKGR